MGVVSRGAYISGAQGFAGEIGHTTVEPNGLQCGCGNHGCLETVASDPAFLKRVLERDGTASFEAVAASLARDFRFSEDLDLTLGYIAIGLATVVNLFNPAAVFVHGRVLTLTDHVLTQLAERVRQRALAPSIHNVQLKIGTGNKLHGAIAGLLNQLFASVGPTLG
jgi:predicted NBD/HSP70 family sugar kinase